MRASIHTVSAGLTIMFLGLAMPARAGIFTGKVTNPNNVGVANVKVDFYESSSGNQIVVTGNLTDVNGNYGVLVPDGTYDVEYVTPPLPGGVVPIRLPAITVVGTVTQNVSRPFGKVLSGNVMDSLGALILTKDIDLNVEDALSGLPEFTPNDNSRSDGHYEVIITPGLKTLTFAPQTVGTTHAAVSFRNVNITSDMTLHVTMPAGVIVTGTVRDASGNPVAGADFDFDSSASKVRIPTPSDNTANDGTYLITVPRGTYDITVEPVVTDRLVAKRVFAVPINRDTTINWTLQSGWSLSGTVAGPGGAVNNCDLDVVDSVTLGKLVTPGDKTNSSGFYEVIVPTGIYDLDYAPPVSTRLAAVIRKNVHIVGDVVVNVSVPPGVLLDGTVRSSSNAVVADADIDVFDAVTKATVPVGGDKTNFNGYYGMVLVPDAYDFEFEPPKARRLQAKKITNVSVIADQTMPVLLDTGLSISGMITGSGPVSGVDVDAITESNGINTFQPGDSSDASGFYQIIVGLVPHTIVFYPPVATRKAAKAITGVNPGADLVLNTALSGGFLVSGTITGTGGAPLAGVRLRAESGGNWAPTTDGVSNASGAYQTVLAAGIYRLLYIPPPGSLDTLELTGVSITKDTVINVSFGSCSTPLAGPGTPSPVNGATGQSTSPTLTWDPISDPCGGAVAYDVYFGTTPTPPLVAIDRSTNSYPVSGLAYTTTYYWKIVAKGIGGRQTTGPAWSFTTQACATALSTPGTPSPVSAATGQPISLNLNWASVTDPCGGSVSYDVYFGTSANPPLVAADRITNSYSVAGLGFSTTYNWKVVVKGAGGRQTAGPVWSFVTQACVAALPAPGTPIPASAATGQPVSVNLTWGSVADPCGGSVSYDVYFGTNPSPPLVAADRTTNSYSAGNLSFTTTYYWKVVAKGIGGRQTTGSVWSFVTQACATALPAPGSPNPANAAAGQTVSPNLTWASVTDPCGGSVSYDVYFGTSTNPPLAASDVSTNSYPASGLSYSTTYHWKVLAKGAGGRITSGQVWSFSSGACTALLPEPSSPVPATGSTGQPPGGVLAWGVISDACGGSVNYDVYFGTAMDPPLAASNLTNNSYSVGALPTSTSYFWRILVKGTNGRQTAGPVWNFITPIEGACATAIPAASGPAPANGSAGQPLGVTISWNPVADPCGTSVSYDVYFGLGFSPSLVASSYSLTDYTVNGLTYSSTYSWKIVVRGSGGRQTPGPVWFFSTNCNCPCYADPQCDATLSNVQDVVQTVNVAFRGSAPAFDSGCYYERTDVDANGVTSVTDVVKVVNVAFRGQTVAANYVDPCP